MWFVIGLMALLGFGAWAAFDRWQVEWSGTPFGAGRFRLITYKGKVRLLRVGLATPSALDFELKRENWIDRLATKTGFSIEPQIGRGTFDRLVYVICDDPRFAALLRQDRTLLDRIERLCHAAPPGFRFQGLGCRRGQLWLNFKPDGDTSGYLDAVRWSLDELAELSRELPALAPATQRKPDRKFLRFVVIIGIAYGMFFNGMAQLFRMGIEKFPQTLDLWQLWAQALPLAVVLLSLMLFATLFLLGRSARLHLVLLEVLLVGGMGAMLTSLTELRDLNIEADQGPPASYPVPVLGKTTHRTRKGGRTYYLDVQDWSGERTTRRISVDSAIYGSVQVGGNVLVKQWPGYLHVRWIESVQRE